MKIAQLCFSPAWGGLEMRCLEDSVRLVERGHEVVPLVAPGAPAVAHFSEQGMRPIEVRAHNYISPLATLKMAQIFKREKVQALHMHRTQDMGPALLAAKLAAVPQRVLTLRMESHKDKFDPYHRWVYGQLTRLLTVSENLCRRAIQHRPIAPQKARCLYNGLDIEKLLAGKEDRSLIRKRWKIDENAFVVGIVGRVEPRKGQHLVLKAGAKLVDQIPDLVLVIVGDETMNKRGEIGRLKNMAQELGIASRVIFTGFQSPPGSIVPAFDVSVLATNRETYGNVTVEAQALGIASIATNEGGMPEIVDDGETGLLVPVEDDEAIRSAIERLYLNPDLRARMGVNGGDRMPERFSLKRHMQELEAVLGGQ